MEENLFTQEDEWAKRVLVRLPGIRERDPWPALDRQPIGPDSRQRVHLVILGFDPYAEALAVHAALVAHYPNFRPEEAEPIRSRITIVNNEGEEWEAPFISRYKPLFDNSFWWRIKGENDVPQRHQPSCCGERQVFTDIEWEFIHADPEGSFVHRLLESWSANPEEQLTVAVSGSSDADNLHWCSLLPPSLAAAQVPVLLRQKDTGPAYQAGLGGNVHLFGMAGAAPEMTRLLCEMGKRVNYLYTCFSGDGVIPGAFPPEAVERAWREKCSPRMRRSSVCNVMGITTKLRSLGHDARDVDAYYDLTEAEADMLARTEHYRWCTERLIAGYRPCTEAERAAIGRNIEQILEARRTGQEPPENLKEKFKEKDIHYDLCAYDELGPDASGRDVKRYDFDVVAGIPLILKPALSVSRRGNG